MQKRIFNKNCLILGKTQVSTQNGVRPSKTLLSTQNNEKDSLGQKNSFLNLDLMQNTVLTRNGWF